MSVELTFLGNVYPDGFIIEGIFVGVEPTEWRVSLSKRAIVIAVHGRIMLVSEGQACAGLALTASFVALPAYWFFFVTLQLPLAAGQADSSLEKLLI